MRIIPIRDVYAQTFTVLLAEQNCRIDVYQKSTGLFLNLYVSDVLIRGGVICENKNLLIRDAYLGFTGDLFFLDTGGREDPSSPGLGSRFVLCYKEASD